MQDYDFDLLCQLAFQSWLDRGQPLGTPERDEGFATSQLGLRAVDDVAQQVNSNASDH